MPEDSLASNEPDLNLNPSPSPAGNMDGPGARFLPGLLERGPFSNESECPLSGCRALRMARSGCHWLERTVHATSSLMMPVAHLVLVAWAMRASSHRGDGLTTRAAYATSPQRPAGADQSYSGSLLRQLLARQLLWERLALILV